MEKVFLVSIQEQGVPPVNYFATDVSDIKDYLEMNPKSIAVITEITKLNLPK